MPINVIKLDGSVEPFDGKKLLKSLDRAGASKEIANAVLKAVKKILKPGITTKKIFKYSFNEYKRLQPILAYKYDLKNSILRLGKSGFPFEEFVKRIMVAKGFECKTNLIVRGKHIPHEIDVDALHGNEHIFLECKHHSQPWFGIKIQTALYIWARYLDLSEKFNGVMLVTNTKFSRQVLQYSKGVGLRLMGWRYPKGNSLEENIEKFHLYPITMLKSLSNKVLGHCLHEKFILIHDLCTANNLDKRLKISKSHANKIKEEASELCLIK